MKVTIAHDYICPWCWIALRQADDLRTEFPDLEFDWIGYELMPESLVWPEPAPPKEENPDRPKTPSRLDLAYAAAGMTPPTAVRPRRMRSHNALEAMEYAKSIGVGEQMNRALYLALWEEGKEINSPEVLAELARGIVQDPSELITAIAEKRFQNKIVPFDEEAYASGIYNVPTFFIDGERYAEQPTAVLKEAIRKALQVAAR